jgi:hypothetical protein
MASEIIITLNNQHGGTYIVEATASYQVDGKSHSCKATVSGGLIKTMPSIPPQARALWIQLVFVAEPTPNPKTREFSWHSPLIDRPNGQFTINLRGVWPGEPSADCNVQMRGRSPFSPLF